MPIAAFLPLVSAAFAMSLFHSPDTGGGSGGGAPTLKQQLDDANAKVSDLESKLTATQNEATKYQAAAEEAKSKLTAAEQARETEAKAHAETKTKLEAASKERDDLAAKDKSAGAKAAEQLAKQGIVPGAKDTPEFLDTTTGDPVAIWESYAQADPATQAKMRAELGPKLDAAAAAFDKAQNK